MFYVIWDLLVLMYIIAPFAPPFKWFSFTSCPEVGNLLTHLALHCNKKNMGNITIVLSKKMAAI